ncbi:MAG: hypothetical protein STSR0002_05070 [Smithella sp.]|jgi:hypothetical protein
MPRRDGTGPQGLGPKTGRGLGQPGTGTETDQMPENQDNVGFFQRLGQNLGLGRFGSGRGIGRGMGKGQGRGQGRNR